MNGPTFYFELSLKIEVDGKRVPKRKIAMLIGYNGKDYYGLQM
jgi:hypothetical protein